MQVERDVDSPFLDKPFEVRDFGTFENSLGGAVTHMDPADCVLYVVEIHGSSLFGAGWADVRDRPAVQVGSHDVLRIGNEEDGRSFYWF